MSNKEHDTITDPEIHEPKGATTAAAGTVYVSDGAGSGSWEGVNGTNIVVVNTIDDFPAASGGVITLAVNTTYILGAPISTADRFEASSGNVEIKGSQAHSTLTYTGSGTMFTTVDASIGFSFVGLSCTSGTFADVTDNTGGVVGIVLDFASLNAGTLGTITDCGFLVVRNSSINLTQGFEISGSNYFIISLLENLLTSASGSAVVLDLGTAIINTLRVNENTVSLPSGGVFLSGSASSANVPSDSIASVVSNQVYGGTTTPLSGIDETDIRYEFSRNSVIISDTDRHGLNSMTGNTTESVITVATTPVLIAGTTTVGGVSHFSGTTAGRLTYIGEKTRRFRVKARASAEPASGTNKTMGLYIAQNGTAITGSKAVSRTDAGSPTSITTFWDVDMAENDYLELYISNDTDTINIVASDIILAVNQ